MDNEDDYPTLPTQRSFSESRVMGLKLIQEGLSPSEVGDGMLIAALGFCVRGSSFVEVSKILYEYADDYALRDARF